MHLGSQAFLLPAHRRRSTFATQTSLGFHMPIDFDTDTPAAWMERDCGNCALCCKLPSIEELNKPADKWCQHCKPGKAHACTIYDSRPLNCQGFKCHWLQGLLPDEWFPAKAKMYLSNLEPGIVAVTVDPSFPTIWRREPYYSLLVHLAGFQRIIIRIGRRYIELTSDGTELDDPPP